MSTPRFVKILQGAMTNLSLNPKPAGGVFGLIFFLSAYILMMQIVLSTFLMVFSRLPMLAVPFSFLGMVLGGICFQLGDLREKKRDAREYASKNLIAAGLLQTGSLFLTRIFDSYRQRNFEHPVATFAEFARMQTGSMFFTTFFYGFYFAAFFFFFGLTVACLYKNYSAQASRIYFFDLAGAALGCVAGVMIFRFFKPGSILILMSAMVFAAVYFLNTAKGFGKMRAAAAAALCFLAVLLGINVKTGYFEIKLSPNQLVRDYEFKEQCETLWSHWNSYSRVDLIKRFDPRTGATRHSFAINNSAGLAQLIPFDPANPFAAGDEPGFNAARLPFLVDNPKDLLVLFAGAGWDMIYAHAYSEGKAKITGVELNPLIVGKALSMPGFHLKEFFALKNIRMVVQEGRSFLEGTTQTYDSIFLSASGASSANYLGVSGYTGQYLYTKEAFISFLKHLKPDGTICVVNKNKLAVIAAAKEAFKAEGIEDISDKVAVFDLEERIQKGDTHENLFKDSNKAFVIFKKSGFSRRDISLLTERIHKFHMAWLYRPGYFHKDFEIYQTIIHSQDTVRLMNELSKEALADISVPVDDRPFIENEFYTGTLFSKNFLKFFFFKEAISHSLGGLINFKVFRFILYLAAAGCFFVLLPLIRKKDEKLRKQDFKIFLYFSGIGIGFIFVEIAVMRLFTLPFGNPVHAFSIVLACLLFSTGLGSYLSSQIKEKIPLSILSRAAAGLLLSYYFILPPVIHAGLEYPVLCKLLLTMLFILPLGACLGMFFPRGIEQLNRYNPSMVPWVWAVNGYMAITGSLASIFLSMSAGFSVFLLISAILYLGISLLKIDKIT